MTRCLFWMLWSGAVVLIVLGLTQVISSRIGWIAVLLITLADALSNVVTRGRGSGERAGEPTRLDAEMIRTENRDYRRALSALRSGEPVEYCGVWIQWAGGEVLAWPAEPVVDGERLAPDEAVRQLRRSSIEFDRMVR